MTIGKNICRAGISVSEASWNRNLETELWLPKSGAPPSFHGAQSQVQAGGRVGAARMAGALTSTYNLVNHRSRRSWKFYNGSVHAGCRALPAKVQNQDRVN